MIEMGVSIFISILWGSYCINNPVALKVTIVTGEVTIVDNPGVIPMPRQRMAHDRMNIPEGGRSERRSL